MIGALGLVALLAAAVPAQPPRCLPDPPVVGVGSPDPFAPPAPKATELNAAAKTLYRQGKWEEARAQYRAASAIDPAFLAPRLNVACSFVRQERFAEATAETRAILERAYVPWAREILEAADLGALKVRPEMEEIRRAMATAAARWGEGLDESVVFVARQRAPLRVPETGEGVFLLNPSQEVYAFTPATGLYRQLTAEDGHVLALARTPDGRRIVFVTAEKLVRAAAGEAALRGVTIGEVTLATMAAAPPLRVEGDLRRIEILADATGVVFRIEGANGPGSFVRAASGSTLVSVPARARPGKRLAVLSARGVAPAASVPIAGGCQAVARDVVAADGARSVAVSARGRPLRKLGERFGAGLAGLPLP